LHSFFVNLSDSWHVVSIIRFKMKISIFLSLALLPWIAAADPSANADRILALSPLRFEPGPGTQPTEFIARGLKSRFVFVPNGGRVQAQNKTLAFKFVRADRHATLEGLDKLRSATGIFIGNDRSKWRPAVPNYGRLQVHSLYRGIDRVYYGNEGKLEYDVVVKPGADPRRIRVAFEGARPNLDRDGNLNAGFVLKRPIAYQVAASGARIPVDSRFKANRDGSFGFALGHYDQTRDLVIDPVITLDQYFGGSSSIVAYAIQHDSHGLIYVAGNTYASDFPTAGAAAGNTPPGGEDIFVAVIDPTKSPSAQITYAAFIGGSDNDSLGGMVVDAKGEMYLTGTTASPDFPIVKGADTLLNVKNTGTTDAFVMKLDTFQVPLYSTFLGGSGNDSAYAIAIDSQQRIWVTGGTQSIDFPIVQGFQGLAGGQDAFISGIDPTQSGSGSLFYSTYLGGSGWDTGLGIAPAPDGTIWIAGNTYSYDFPQGTNPAYQSRYGTGGDGFVAQINTTAGGSYLVYSTFLGGNDTDGARNIILSNGQVIVSGYTLSKNFPVTSNALQPQYGGDSDAFVTILNPTAGGPASSQLVYSTFFGGNGPDVPFDLKMDTSGNLYIAGYTMSPGLPATPNAPQAAYDGSMDAFALEFNPSTPGPAALSYFTYLGSDGLQNGYGIDFDSTNGLIYLTGYTTGPLFDPFGGPGNGNPGVPNAFVVGFGAPSAATTAPEYSTSRKLPHPESQ
jgi:hypothetical protein